MSESHVEVVRIGSVSKLPNADTLEITEVHGGYPVIFRSGQFNPGDLAVYIPVDALVDGARDSFSFLGAGLHRIKAKRLRGTFSMGLLVEPPAGASEGDDMRDALGVGKWEPAIDRSVTNAPVANAPPGAPIPVYNLEGLRRYRGALFEGELVVLTEKIHGANARIVRTEDGVVHVGSRTQWKLEEGDKLWWPAVRAAGLVEAMAKIPVGHVVYGEVFGQVQDLKYGHAPGSVASFRCFDVYDRKTCRFLDFYEAVTMVRAAGIETVPTLHIGHWSSDLLAMAEGESTIGRHVREGFVIRPAFERKCGQVRCVFKMVGEGYLTRKESKETAQ